MALLVEGFRDFQEWWQTRVPWRTDAARATREQDDVAVNAPTRRRSSEVEDCVEAVLDRHGRKQVGIAVGVCWQAATWTFARGRVGAGRPEPPAADTIFEIGSITKVFTAMVLADMVQEGLVALEDPVQRYLPEGLQLPVRGRPITLLEPRHADERAAATATRTALALAPPAGQPLRRFTSEQFERAIRHARLRRAPGEKQCLDPPAAAGSLRVD